MFPEEKKIDVKNVLLWLLAIWLAVPLVIVFISICYGIFMAINAK